MRNTILITGASGQLGRQLCKDITSHKVVPLSRADLNFNKLEDFQTVIRKYNPNLIINCAAYTNVEKAEGDFETAKRINCDAVKELAIVSKELKIPLIHFSTDYVFDGQKISCYSETDHPNPKNNYGLTKLLGEQQIIKHLNQYLILRTSWVYSKNHGRNFYQSMISLFKREKLVKVVNDQFGAPTNVEFLSSRVVKLIDKIFSSKFTDKIWGLYHLTEDKTMSWFEFALLIFSENKDKNLFTVKQIKGISSSEYESKVDRPHNSCLSNELFDRTFDLRQ